MKFKVIFKFFLFLFCAITCSNPAYTTDSIEQYGPNELKKDEFLEIKVEDLEKENRNKGKYDLSIGYIKDDFDYKDPRGIFNQVYESESKSVKGGILFISMDQFLGRRFVDFFWGMNLGLGYNSGNGFFANGDRSDVKFSLWTFPIDLSFGMGIPLGPLAKINIAGGPSVMGLLQTRDDKAQGEKNKTRRQVSPGYFAEAAFKINLSWFFTKSMFDLYRNNSVTSSYLDLFVRTNDYSNFQDDLTISGTSIGVAFSFEYF